MYVVSAHKPTAVSHAVTGNFTRANDLNLVVSKFNRIELFTVTADGLRLQADIGLYGRIASLQLFRPPQRDTDLLFVSTERYQFAVLSYNADTNTIVTEAAGTTRNEAGKPTPSGQICLVEPDSRVIVVHQYMGLLKVIPIDKRGQLSDAFSVRLEELHVISIQCLHNCAKPTIAVLYQDARDARHLKTYEIQLADKSLGEGPWQLANVAGDASMLIPVPKPCGGVIIVGSQSVTFKNNITTLSIGMPLNEMVAFGQIDADGKRFLIGDYAGGLHILFLSQNHTTVTDMKLQKLGETSRASALCYLDNSVVYVGSKSADSQLIRLNTEADESGAVVEVLDSFTNLGPIVDFCVVDLERQRQGQVVTCSGFNKDGSLRVVRSGVGINEQAVLDFPGIKGMWSLKGSTQSPFDNLLAVSFIGETRFLSFNGDELEEIEVDGFVSDQQSLFCGNLAGDLIVQVTSRSVRLVASSSKQLVQEWTPDAGQSISMASCHGTQIVVASSGGNLAYIELLGDRLQPRTARKLPSEIACVNATPLGGAVDGRATLCAVGLWGDMSVRLLRLPDLEEVASETTGGDYIPRSVLLATLDTVSYLLVALGDGQLHSFELDPATGALRDRKKLALGTQPISLHTFRSKQSTHVFAASDRPTVIYGSNRKLLFSNVNVKEVNFMTALNAEAFPDSLAIANDNGLTIGTIDDIQKLHIRTVPLGESPRRIAHQDSSMSYAVITIRQEMTATEEIETSFVRLIDEQTFETLDTFKLDENEQGTSITSITFADDPKAYYVVGSAYVIPSEDCPTQGRIRILQVVGRHLKQVADKEVKGTVFSMDSLNGKLAAAIDNKINIYKWNETSSGARELVSESGHHYNIMALHLRTRGDFLVIGDLLKSMTLLRALPEGNLEEVARDYQPNWTTAVEIIDDETFIGAENESNMFLLKRNADVNTEEARKLGTAGLFHFGDMINKYQHGSLVMRLPEHETAVVPSLLFGTVSGVLGVVATMPPDRFAFLSRVQQNLTHIIRGVGGFTHADWRTFSNEHRVSESFNFLDGDLIELFLELPRDKMEAVVRGDNGGQLLTNTSVDDLIKTIEELTRLH